MKHWLQSIPGLGHRSEEATSRTKTLAIDSSAPEATAVGWIGVDLDGTLAAYDGWKGFEHIGRPVPLMKQRVLEWVQAGHVVRVFTARASVPEGIPPVQRWLEKNGFPPFDITNQKDFYMVELWDDRAVQVLENSGRPIISSSLKARPKSPLLASEQAHETYERADPPSHKTL